MTLTAILTMAAVLSVTWGLFGVLLFVAQRREKRKHGAESPPPERGETTGENEAQ